MKKSEPGKLVGIFCGFCEACKIGTLEVKELPLGIIVTCDNPECGKVWGRKDEDDE